MELLFNVEIFGLQVITLLQLAIGLFLSITFLQAGLDKLFDFNGNKAYFTDQFKGSILEKQIPLLFPIILIKELAAGILSLIGLVFILLGDLLVSQLGAIVAIITFLSLYFGQRVAKDYVGASGLVPYFITSLLGLIILSI